MIAANDALNLPEAQLTDEDLALAKDVMKHIDRHIRAKMTFAGPEALEMGAQKLNYSAAKVVCVWMKRLGWNMNANLGVKQSELGGRSMIWQLAFSPAIESYEAFIPEFEIKPRLDA